MSWYWQNFTLDEMRCKGTGKYPEITDDIATFMDRLQAIRDEAKFPLVVTSGYRSPEYNSKISSTGTTGPHTTGRAVDILIRGDHAYRLTELAFAHGMTGIGIAQKGKTRFIHLDDLTKPGPRPRIWSN